jgi:hypothetical protein
LHKVEKGVEAWRQKGVWDKMGCGEVDCSRYERSLMTSGACGGPGCAGYEDGRDRLEAGRDDEEEEEEVRERLLSETARRTRSMNFQRSVALVRIFSAS